MTKCTPRSDIGVETMDEPITIEPISIDTVLFEAEMRERQEEFRAQIRKQEKRGLKTFMRYVAGTVLTGALVIGEIVGINYLANERAFTKYDGTRVESQVVGWFGHTRFSENQEGSRTITYYDPFATTTMRSYTDIDGDGEVDSVWRTRGHTHPLYGTRGSMYGRGDAVFNENYIDGIFQEGLESFGEPLTLEPRSQ